MTRKKTSIVRAATGYDAVLADVVALIDAGRQAVVRTSNAIMTATYWGVGRRIVEEEQHGATRAEYGEALISRLSQDLQGTVRARLQLREPVADAVVLSGVPRDSSDSVWRIWAWTGGPETSDSV